MIRVIIVDDHEIVRKGLIQIMAEVPDIEVKGEAGDAHEALALVRAGRCDVAVIDLTMPGKSGLDLLQDLRREFPKLPVLVLSMHSEDEYAVRVIKAGAAGFLTKRSAPRELIGAIRKVYQGGRYISTPVAEALASSIQAGGEGAPHEKLSDREFQVMRMIAAGRSLREIADDLSLSEKTIGTYRTRILEKMGMKKNVELVRYVLLNNLTE
jgi:two-component system, NarL family, invasion response regulator UvrY